MSDELNAVQVGDELLYHRGYGSPAITLIRVTHLTPTQIVAGANRYRKSDGGRIGDTGFGRARVTIPTDADRERIARHNAINDIRRATSESTAHVSATRLTEIAQELRA